MPKNIAIFASGSGSNAENIVRYFQNSEDFSFPLIISNKSDAYVHERAKNLNIKSVSFKKVDFESGEEILALLQDHRIDAIVLAGFLLKVPETIIMPFLTILLTYIRRCFLSSEGKGCMATTCTKPCVHPARPKAESPSILSINITTTATLFFRQNAS